MNVQRPPRLSHRLKLPPLSGPQRRSNECPDALLGVDTAAVNTLQPSKNEEASECVYCDVTKVMPVNQPPSER
jgi:hypothetical protein